MARRLEGRGPAGTARWAVFNEILELDERYELIKPIGKGVHTLVCSARDHRTGQTVAISKVREALSDVCGAQRMLRTLRLQRLLKHENILAVKDILIVERHPPASQQQQQQQPTPPPSLEPPLLRPPPPPHHYQHLQALPAQSLQPPHDSETSEQQEEEPRQQPRLQHQPESQSDPLQLQHQVEPEKEPDQGPGPEQEQEEQPSLLSPPPPLPPSSQPQPEPPPSEPGAQGQFREQPEQQSLALEQQQQQQQLWSQEQEHQQLRNQPQQQQPQLQQQPQPQPSIDVYVVYEHMDVDLRRAIRSPQHLSNEHCIYFIYQTLCGLKLLHSAGWVHSELRPDRLLLTTACDLRIRGLGYAQAMRFECRPPAEEMFVARWYTAPERLGLSDRYTAAADIWSVGCILAELLGREPLFPAHSYAEGLRVMLGTLGSPSEDELGFITSPRGLEFVRALPRRQRADFGKAFPDADPLAIDLMEKMLQFDPRKRIDVHAALKHPWLAQLHDEAAEPSAAGEVALGYDASELDVQSIRDMLYNEADMYGRIVPRAFGHGSLV